MPAKSRQQYKFFKYLEENPEEAKARGIKESSVHDFTKDMTKGKFKRLKEKIGKK